MTFIATQSAIFNRLESFTALTEQLAEHVEFSGEPGIYDHVTQAADSGDDSAFPYVVIGSDDFTEFDTDDSTGFDADLTIHVWSREKGRAETKRIQQAIYDALHRHDLTVAGSNTVTLEQQFAQTVVDPDGVTRHGVQGFRLLLDNV